MQIKKRRGDICALDLKNSSAEPKIIKKVYVGQPEIKLWDEYIAWTERTGSERDKIFVCHIPTEETTVVQYFNSSGYGASMPYFENGKLIWAGRTAHAHAALQQLHKLKRNLNRRALSGSVCP